MIDAQHKGLFAAINALIDAAASGHAHRIPEPLDRLISHVMDHFRDEERELERCGYDGLRQHRLSHGVLLERMLTLRHQVLEDASRAGELIAFLADDVVAGHMRDEDRRFSRAVTGQARP
jgi:hemerythrin